MCLFDVFCVIYVIVFFVFLHLIILKNYVYICMCLNCERCLKRAIASKQHKGERDEKNERERATSKRRDGKKPRDRVRERA